MTQIYKQHETTQEIFTIFLKSKNSLHKVQKTQHPKRFAQKIFLKQANKNVLP